MQLQLLDNGIDSLHQGVRFYKMYLTNGISDFEEHSCLKLAVICIHNAIEILSKKMLSDVNELLIYKEMSETLLEFIGKQCKYFNETGYQMELHDSLISGDADVFTIEYRECIKRIKIIFCIDDKYIDDLIQLGNIRNKITHFGLDRDIDYHNILGVLNRTLDFIVEFFYSKFSEGRTNPMEFLYDEILFVIDYGESIEQEVWGAYFSETFIELNEVFKKLFMDTSLDDILREKGLKMEISTGKLEDSQDIRVEISSEDGKKCYQLYTVSNPRLDSTILADEDYLYAVIDHSDANLPFYIYKKPIELKSYEESYKRFWIKDKNCYKTDFNTASIRKIIEFCIGT